LISSKIFHKLDIHGAPSKKYKFFFINIINFQPETNWRVLSIKYCNRINLKRASYTLSSHFHTYTHFTSQKSSQFSPLIILQPSSDFFFHTSFFQVECDANITSHNKKSRILINSSYLIFSLFDPK
jgi:hypothetical protein